MVQTPLHQQVRLVASDDVRSFVAAHGGAVYVKARSQRCCTGSLTVLDVTTERPSDLAGYERVEDPVIDVYLRVVQPRRPDELFIELKGRKRPKLAAFWDGCAYVI
jgi:hypothetical protein